MVANSRNITEANPFPAPANVALVDGDIGDPCTAAKIVETAVSPFGRIDVLINNAGVFIPKPFTEYTTEDFNTLVSTTLAGFLYVSQLAVKQMLRQKSGSIVNISTTLVDQPIAGVGAAVQIMLKGALNAVTRALAIKYAKEGIRVNAIAPGVINTPMHKPETHDFLKGLHPVGRIGEVKDMARPTASIVAINYLSDLAECNPENDNLDVHAVLDDGREFTFTVATPNNIFWCMENEGTDYFFGEPVVFVKNLTKENIAKAIERIVAEDGGKWLTVYGS